MCRFTPYYFGFLLRFLLGSNPFFRVIPTYTSDLQYCERQCSHSTKRSPLPELLLRPNSPAPSYLYITSGLQPHSTQEDSLLFCEFLFECNSMRVVILPFPPRTVFFPASVHDAMLFSYLPLRFGKRPRYQPTVQSIEPKDIRGYYCSGRALSSPLIGLSSPRKLIR